MFFLMYFEKNGYIIANPALDFYPAGACSLAAPALSVAGRTPEDFRELRRVSTSWGIETRRVVALIDLDISVLLDVGSEASGCETVGRICSVVRSERGFPGDIFQTRV